MDRAAKTPPPESGIPEDWGDLTPGWVRKAPPWIASLALHAVLVLVAMATIFNEATPKANAQIVQIRPSKMVAFKDTRLPPSLIDRPDIKLTNIIPKPVEDLDTDEPIVETPRGKPDAHSTKDLKRDHLNDHFGIGTGGGEKAGEPTGEFRGRRPPGTGPIGNRVQIGMGLDWLVRHQSPDGSWKSAHFEEVCDDGGCSGPGFEGYDVGVTSLAVLAFAGTGNTPWHGRHKRIVRRAMKWLLSQQGDDGAIGRTKAEGWMYNHAMATMALCELRAMGGSHAFRLRPSTESAVDFCLRSQNPGNGWRYEARSGDNDTSITGWMVLALKAARIARMNVPDESFQSARNFIDRATAANGATGYRAPDGASAYLQVQFGKYDPVPTMTAVGVLCRRLTGQRRSEKVVKDGVEILLTALPTTDSRRLNHYYWYYGTYALFQASNGPNDRRWKEWNRAVQKALVGTQVPEGKSADRGSWAPTGEWGIAGGRVYATAINLLTLEASFRYQRVK